MAGGSSLRCAAAGPTPTAARSSASGRVACRRWSKRGAAPGGSHGLRRECVSGIFPRLDRLSRCVPAQRSMLSRGARWKHLQGHPAIHASLDDRRLVSSLPGNSRPRRCDLFVRLAQQQRRPAAAWGDGQHGRIWRLSWEGSPLVPDAPAIALGPIDSWAHLATADDASLLKSLENRDLELRSRAMDELVRHGEKNRDALLAIAKDVKRPPYARATAIAGVSRLWNPAVLDAMLALLKDENLELRRMAAEEIDGNVAAGQVTNSLMHSLATALSDPQPAPRRAAALAIGRAASLVAQANPLQAQAADILFRTLRKDDRSDRFLHDGILRALERLGKTGTDLLAGAASLTTPKHALSESPNWNVFALASRPKHSTAFCPLRINLTTPSSPGS